MKAISKDLKSYSISDKGTLGVKSHAIFGFYKPNIIAPLVYLRKPKWVSDKDFERIVSSLKLELVIMESKGE